MGTKTDKATLLDRIVAKHEEEVAAEARYVEIRDEMDRLLAQVPDADDVTQVDVAGAIGVSKSRIGQRIRRAEGA